MEIGDLFTKEIRQLAPLKKGNGSEITPELLKDWAIEIGKKAFESDESMSSGEEIG